MPVFFQYWIKNQYWQYSGQLGKNRQKQAFLIKKQTKKAVL